MSDKPLVSIIIPTFNRAHLIGETLESVLAQTYTNWECIVVDDGSTDNTNEIMTAYCAKDFRIQYYHRPKDRLPGGNSARNYGFELSLGDYIQWFDSDDIMHSSKLSFQVSYLKESDYPFTVCQTEVFEETIDRLLGLRHDVIHSLNPLRDFIKMDLVFMTPSAIYKRSFLERFSLKFDEELKAAQEWAFISRALFFSTDYHYTDRILVLIRKHQSSISYQKDSKQQKSYHYFLARKKVLDFFNEQSSFRDPDALKIYLKNYLKDYFIGILYKTTFRETMKIYFLGIYPLYGFLKNIEVFLFVLFAKLTGKGYSFRNRIIT